MMLAVSAYLLQYIFFLERRNVSFSSKIFNETYGIYTHETDNFFNIVVSEFFTHFPNLKNH